MSSWARRCQTCTSWAELPHTPGYGQCGSMEMSPSIQVMQEGERLPKSGIRGVSFLTTRGFCCLYHDPRPVSGRSPEET